MNQRNHDVIFFTRMLIDMIMVCVSWVLAFYLRFSGFLPIHKGVPEIFLYFKLIPFIAIIWLGVFSGNGFYRRSRRRRSAFLEALDILQSCILATLCFIAFTYVYEEYRYSRVVMLVFAVLHPWALISGRSLFRKFLRRYRRRVPAKPTLLIGGGEILDQAIRLIQSDFLRSEILGVILAGPPDQISQGEKIVTENHLKIIPMPKDWVEFFSRHSVASVTFAMPTTAYDYFDRSLETIVDQVPEVRFVPDLIRFTRFAAGVEVIDGLPVISINESPLAGFGQISKRAMDILGAIVGFLIFGPLMIVIALLVKWSSAGPIFYVQERMGLDGKTFRIYKFRSMPVDAEKATGPIWMSAGDNRPTRIGRILRSTNLDELPQFFNVLIGDMSLVGPRPERPIFVEQFRRNVPGYYLRHKTKAGMTGWAQVNGWRGNTSIERRIECDLYYIQNWSLWFDIKIILLTVFNSFIDKNAY